MAEARAPRRHGAGLRGDGGSATMCARRISHALGVERFRSGRAFDPQFRRDLRRRRQRRARWAGLNADQVRYLLSYTAQQASGLSCWARDTEQHRESIRLRWHAGAQWRDRRNHGRHGFFRRRRCAVRRRAFFSCLAASMRNPGAWSRGSARVRDHEYRDKRWAVGLPDPGAARRRRQLDREARRDRAGRRSAPSW